MTHHPTAAGLDLTLDGVDARIVQIEAGQKEGGR